MKVKKLNGDTAKLLLVLGFMNLDIVSEDQEEIEININADQLAQAILSAGEDIQEIYGQQPEWLELVNQFR